MLPRFNLVIIRSVMTTFLSRTSESKESVLPRYSHQAVRELLAAYDASKNPAFLNDLKIKIQEVAAQKRQGPLISILNGILSFTRCDKQAGKPSVLRQVLPLFFRQLSKNQLATLFIHSGDSLLLHLLLAHEDTCVARYLALFHDFLEGKLVSTHHYREIVLSSRVTACLIQRETVSREQVRVYLGGIFPVLKRMQMNYSLILYVHLLHAAEFQVSDETPVFKAQLRLLKRRFLTQTLSAAAYFLELSTTDAQGFTLLHHVFGANHPGLAQIYLSCLAALPERYPLKPLLLAVGPQQFTCLDAIAISGNLQILSIFTEFLIQHFGPQEAQFCLMQLARIEDAEGCQTGFSEGDDTHPMNIILELLRANRGEEAFSYLRRVLTTQPMSTPSPSFYTAFLKRESCKLFFNEPKHLSPQSKQVFLATVRGFFSESKLETLALTRQQEESCLSKDLVKKLEGPLEDERPGKRF